MRRRCGASPPPLALLAAACSPEGHLDHSWTLTSPDGQLAVRVVLAAGGRLTYDVLRDGRPVLAGSRLGLRRADTGFDSGLETVHAGEVTVIDEAYELLHGKTSRLHDHASEQTIRFSNSDGALLDLVLRAYDDGVAFRYVLPGAGEAQVTDELTSFNFAAPGRAWMQPVDLAGRFTPAYEGLHTNGLPLGRSAPVPAWSLPALMSTGPHWVLLTESDLDDTYFGLQLDRAVQDFEYRAALPQPGEGNGLGDREPSSRLPWTMPWRVIIVGDSPGVAIESNLVTHLARSSQVADASWVKPGRVSWSWWSDQASPRNPETLRAFVDLAAELGWEYSLVDANWTEMPAGAIPELVEYAAGRSVGIFLWYNSGGPHNEVTEAPRDRMHDPQTRRTEMARLAEWGVAGVKVDFFHRDKQDGIRLYLDILRDAAEYRLLVNFHGSTYPRGWTRTWPHLMTMEGVRGAEQYIFEPGYPEEAPWLNTVLPFTRNAVGPMDYTPVTFSDNVHPHLTTNAHELALAVVFESSLQHFADSAAGYRGAPDEVREFLAAVPTAWHETRYIAGEPGTAAVIARRRGNDWYVGGINGTGETQQLDVDLGFLAGEAVRRFTGDGRRGFTVTDLPQAPDILSLELAPYDGFVVTTAA